MRGRSRSRRRCSRCGLELGQSGQQLVAASGDVIVLEVLFLLLEPAIEAGLGAGGDFRLVVPGTAVKSGQEALTGRLNLR